MALDLWSQVSHQTQNRNICDFFLKPFVNFAEIFVESNSHLPHPPHLSCTYEFVLEKSTQGCKKLGDASDSLS